MRVHVFEECGMCCVDPNKKKTHAKAHMECPRSPWKVIYWSNKSLLCPTPPFLRNNQRHERSPLLLTLHWERGTLTSHLVFGLVHKQQTQVEVAAAQTTQEIERGDSEFESYYRHSAAAVRRQTRRVGVCVMVIV